ncbi:hypothetical protein I7I53_10972 [Histoplasma capsulatum var. duboisii H88]|uniref:Uncharacterized protein n=1 Tax=Ajellomyces capsulatus (strain H88) TaxID=544711 RepID=A0A8A1LBW2_AJEC8|nr:hypothetical protein I7I53_10972 [Histoplasma capsulatum var. duboisii H88]
MEFWFRSPSLSKPSDNAPKSPICGIRLNLPHAGWGQLLAHSSPAVSVAERCAGRSSIPAGVYQLSPQQTAINSIRTPYRCTFNPHETPHDMQLHHKQKGI